MRCLLLAGIVAAAAFSTASANEICNNAAKEFGNIVLRKVASEYCSGFKPTEQYSKMMMDISTKTCPNFKAVFNHGAELIQKAASSDARANAKTYCESTLKDVGP